MAAPRRAVGQSAGLSCVHAPFCRTHVSPSFPVLLIPPKMTDLPVAISKALTAPDRSGGPGTTFLRCQTGVDGAESACARDFSPVKNVVAAIASNDTEAAADRIGESSEKKCDPYTVNTWLRQR